VLPGGESTAISLIGEKNGIFEALKKWVQCGNPVWGTCAGCIMLAKDVQGQKQGGYENKFSKTKNKKQKTKTNKKKIETIINNFL
jgi:5'-phosphate synthase pdxT subunit